MVWGRRSKKKGRSMIKAEKMVVDGIEFDSKLEGRRYKFLLVMLESGKIRDLERQPKYPLERDGRPLLIRSRGYPNGRRSNYTADFKYVVVATGEVVIEEVKGYDTPIDRLRRSVAEWMHDVRFDVVTSSRAWRHK